LVPAERQSFEGGNHRRPGGLQRVGIGGVLYMEVDQGAPLGPADFAGPLWRELFQHACKRGHRLGLEINMNNDAGWCGSGGPWITPELSMQRVVWTETVVQGPKSACRRALARTAGRPRFLPGHRRAGHARAGGQGPHPRTSTASRPSRRSTSRRKRAKFASVPADSVIPARSHRRFDGQDG
jgi:hypothetical protein